MSVIKVYGGAAWLNPFFKYPKIYNGTNWVYGIPRVKNSAQSGWESSATDSVTVTVGTASQTTTGTHHTRSGTTVYTTTVNYYGYDTLTPSFGSISSTASNLFLNGTTQAVFATVYNNYFGSTNYDVYFTVTNPTDAVVLWTTMNINGTNYTRASATLSKSGNQYNYSWNAIANPFGTSGTKTVSWS